MRAIIIAIVGLYAALVLHVFTQCLQGFLHWLAF